MLVTNFKLKYVLNKIVCAFYQLGDVGRIHPMPERSLRALQRTTDYIERAMPDAIGFEAPAELLAFALEMVKIEGQPAARFVSSRERSATASFTASTASKACPRTGAATILV